MDAPNNEASLCLKSTRILRMSLMCIGGWPGEVLGEKKSYLSLYLRKQVFVQTAVFTFAEIYYIIEKFQELTFFEVGHMYITVFLTILTCTRTTLLNFKRYGEISKEFFTKFHLIHYRNKGEFYEKTYTKINKVSYCFTAYLMSMMVIGMMLYNLTPMYNNIKLGLFTNTVPGNVTLDFSIYYKLYPGFDQADNFYLFSGLNYFFSLVCSVSICSIDLLMSLIVFQIIGHLEILRNNFENFPMPQKTTDHGNFSVEMYNDDENIVVKEKLKECVNHHRLIVGFTDEMSEFFGPTLAFYYCFHLVSGCLLLLECSTGEPIALMRYGPLTIIIFGQLMQISIIYEVLGSESEKLVDSVYSVPWEYMNTSNRRSVVIILTRVQRPIHVTAMGITPIGVQPMAKILKTTFSYFAFLRSMNK